MGKSSAEEPRNRETLRQGKIEDVGFVAAFRSFELLGFFIKLKTYAHVNVDLLTSSPLLFITSCLGRGGANVVLGSPWSEPR